MSLSRKKFMTIDEYIVEFPGNIQEILQKIRKTIHESVPIDIEETIAYQIPTFKLKKKNLAHFAAFKNHISFFPTPSGIIAFKNELSAYESSKGTIKFPLNEPIPYELIRKIVQFRVQELLGKKL